MGNHSFQKTENKTTEPASLSKKDAERLPASAGEKLHGLHSGIHYNFGKINLFSNNNHTGNQGIPQPKLEINQPGDQYEQEADRMVDKVMRMTKPSSDQNTFSQPAISTIQRNCAHCEEEEEKEEEEQQIQRKESQSGTPEVNSGLINYVNNLDNSGAPLLQQTRSYFEPRFGYDFSNVRVHIDSKAAESTGKINAQAYTYGNHIIFSKGHYNPYTIPGHKLLSHELTHVVQQANGSMKSNDSHEQEAVAAEKGTFIAFKPNNTARLQLQLSPDRAVRLTIILGANNQAEFILNRDDGEPLSTTGTAGGLNPGTYQVFTNPAGSQMIIRSENGSALPESSRFYMEIPRTAIQIRRLLLAVRSRSPIPMEVRTGTATISTTDSGQITAQPSSTPEREAIDRLPERIRTIFLNETATREFQPEDYPAILRIGRRLMELSESELEEFRSRTIGRTSSLSVFEAYVNQYFAERTQRVAAGEETERLKLRLYGLEELYRLYKNFTRLGESRTLVPSRDEFGVRDTHHGLLEQEFHTIQSSLQNALARNGFSGITEFEALITAFEQAFQRQTILIAQEMLDRYEHTLYEQQQRYQNSEGARGLAQSISHTQARQFYGEATQQQRIHDSLRPDPELHRPLPAEREMRQQARTRRGEALRSAEAQMTIVAADHPLIANPDFNRADLAQAPEDQVQSIMLRYISQRREDVRTTRQNINDNPNMIWELDALLQRAMLEQDIRPNSVFHLIIQDHIAQHRSQELIRNLAISVFAIAAGIVSGGTGTVAVLGATTALGISSYQAFEEFRQYERMSAAHGAQLLTDDPSFAWVVVAVIGVGLDMVAAASAIRSLRPAIQAFNAGPEAGNLVALEQRLAALTEVEERIRRNVIRAAEAEAEARAAWRSVLRPPAVLRAVIVPGAEEFGRLVYAVYLSFRAAGIRAVGRFIERREARDLIENIAQLSQQDRILLEQGYRQALEQMDNIAAHGVSLQMSESEIHAFIRRWNNRPAMTTQDIMQEMTAWRATRQSHTPFGFRDADHFNEFRSVAQQELTRAVRRSDPQAQAFLQGSSISGIAYARQVPFDAASDLDIAIVSRYLFRQAERGGRRGAQATDRVVFEVSLSPRRIGPLDADQLRELGLHRLAERLDRALSEGGPEYQRTINFMLFENEAAMRAPIGQNSTETTRAASLLSIE